MIKAFLEFYDHVERREHSVHSTDTIADHVWAAPSVCGYGNQPDSAMTGTDVVGYDQSASHGSDPAFYPSHVWVDEVLPDFDGPNVLNADIVERPWRWLPVIHSCPKPLY